VIVGVLLYSLPIFEWDSIWERIWIRILLIPVVIGVSYEVLRFTNALRDIPVLKVLGYPGCGCSCSPPRSRRTTRWRCPSLRSTGCGNWIGR